MQALYGLSFPARANYQNYNDINEAYNDFIQKIVGVIDKVAPIKERRVKQNSQEWLDWEITDEIKNRDKLFKKFKKLKLHVDKDIYDSARFKLQKMVFEHDVNSVLKGFKGCYFGGEPCKIKN